MIELIHKRDGAAPDVPTLTLTWEQRQRSRSRVTLDDGREAGLRLPRGTNLHDGDCLLTEDGLAVRLVAARETLSRVDCPDALGLARAAYHLGNRHVPVQIEPGCLRYRHDHVLDELVHGLGLDARLEQRPFQPESGAYQGTGDGATSGHAHPHRHDGD